MKHKMPSRLRIHTILGLPSGPVQAGNHRQKQMSQISLGAIAQ